MNRRAIREHLQKKFSEFTSSISDAEMRRTVRENGYITGGAITSLLLGEEPNDYDIYFRTRESCLAVARYFADMTMPQTPTTRLGENRFMMAVDNYHAHGQDISVLDEGDRITMSVVPRGHVYLEDAMQYKPMFISPNAITLSGNIQLITRFFGEPIEVHEYYDFEHCRCYYSPFDGTLVLPASSLESILTKELVYTGSKYPLASIIRTRKFMERGWNISAGEYVKMALQLNEFNLLDTEVLKEQLCGVDLQMFEDVIQEIKNQTEEGAELTNELVIDLIDERFYGEQEV